MMFQEVRYVVQFNERINNESRWCDKAKGIIELKTAQLVVAMHSRPEEIDKWRILKAVTEYEVVPNDDSEGDES